MTWLTGRPKAEYLSYGHSVTFDPFETNPIAKKREYLVELKRNIGNNHECGNSFASSELAHYLESLTLHSAKVWYTVTCDFYESRGYLIESIGDFGHEPAAQSEIGIGMLGGGEKTFRQL